MRFSLFLLTLLPLGLLAQEKGTRFDHELSWQQIKAKAKAENKYILLDCFTTWCGPCRYLRDSIFPLEEAGNFFNDKFICVKVQMDTTKDDNEYVKAWYANAHHFREEYKLTGYPTLYFFSPDGELVHRMVGAGDIKKLLSGSADAFNPDTRYYNLLKKAKEGTLTDSATLCRLAKADKAGYDKEGAAIFTAQYLATQKDPRKDPTTKSPAVYQKHD